MYRITSRHRTDYGPGFTDLSKRIVWVMRQPSESFRDAYFHMNHDEATQQQTIRSRLKSFPRRP
jgi:hypothetical protein